MFMGLFPTDGSRCDIQHTSWPWEFQPGWTFNIPAMEGAGTDKELGPDEMPLSSSSGGKGQGPPDITQKGH